MPYVSQAQERFFHSKGATKAGISKKTVAEFDRASKGMSLPKTAPKSPGYKINPTNPASYKPRKI